MLIYKNNCQIKILNETKKEVVETAHRQQRYFINKKSFFFAQLKQNFFQLFFWDDTSNFN